MAWNRGFHILLDGDIGGINAKKTYIKTFGLEIENLVSTFIDVDPQFKDKAIEDLFSEEEKLNITKYFDPKATKYDKSKFNTGLQSLMIEKKKLSISKETTSNFKEIFEYLKTKL